MSWLGKFIGGAFGFMLGRTDGRDFGRILGPPI